MNTAPDYSLPLEPLSSYPEDAITATLFYYGTIPFDFAPDREIKQQVQDWDATLGFSTTFSRDAPFFSDTPAQNFPDAMPAPENAAEASPSFPALRHPVPRPSGMKGSWSSILQSVVSDEDLGAKLRRKAVRPVQSLACFFCRGRKIACGPLNPASEDQTCGQCAKRGLKCEYPTESRRGQRRPPSEVSTVTAAASGRFKGRRAL